MLELVDRLVLGTSARNSVRVRVSLGSPDNLFVLLLYLIEILDYAKKEKYYTLYL